MMQTKQQTGLSMGIKLFIGVFVLVMGAVIVVSYMSYSFSKSTITDQVSKATQQTVEQIGGKLDLMLGIYDGIGLQVLKNKPLRDALEKAPDRSEYAGFQQAEKIINAYMTSYRESDPHMIGARLVRNGPDVLSQGVVGGKENYYSSVPTNNLFFNELNTKYAKQMIDAKGQTVFSPMFKKGFYTQVNTDAQRITTGSTFVMGKLLVNLQKPEATHLLMLEVNSKAIEQIIKDANLGEGSDLLIVSPENKIIYANDMDLIESDSPVVIDEELASEPKGTFFADLNGEENMVVFQTSKLSGWKVIGYLPTSILYKDIETTMQLSITTSIVMFLIVALSLVMLRRFITTHQSLQVYSHQLEQTSQELKEKNSALTEKTDEVLQQSELLAQQNDQLGRQSRELERKNRELAKQSEELEKKNDELHQLNQVKDKILANTSHELRTPLNGIIGIADSLIEGVAGKVNEKMQQNLQMIVMSGRRLSSLVNDILDFSKLKSNKFILSRRPVSAYDLVNLVMLLSKPLLGDKKVDLKNDMGRELPLIDADENRFQQVLHNLLSNAIKFTEQGSVRVTAQVEGDKLALSVHDTGIGIPQDKQQDIFKSFEQVDGSIARKYGGTGLGLSVTKQLVELHGGEVRVSSVEGKGSTFTVTIPLAKTDQEDKEAQSAIQKRLAEAQVAMSEPATINSDRQIKVNVDTAGDFNVLIVDDEPINLQVLSNQLSAYDFGLTTVNNGIEALALLKAGKKFDIVLLDVMMPEMSGYDVCQQIRKSHPIGELPVILLTAKNQTEDLITGFQSGANDYLVKPFSKQELLVRMNTHLKLAKSSRQLKAMKERIESQSQSYAQEIESLKKQIGK